MIVALLLFGCEPVDPMFDAWNSVFSVQTVEEGEGCDVPATAADGDEPFVGIGWGVDPRDLTEVLSVYWCPTQLECRPGPFANVVLDASSPEAISGKDTTTTLTPGSLCTVAWEGVDAVQSATGALTLDVQKYRSGSVFVIDAAECDAILQAAVGTTCDTSQRIVATRVQ